MLEDFASDAGTFEPGAAFGGRGPTTQTRIDARWEKRLRRALGDDYELLELLGTGGFGRVYRVRDLHLERLVALKVLHPVADPGPERGRALSPRGPARRRLDHPNIVNIYDIGGRSGLHVVHDGADRRPQPGAAGRADGPLPMDKVLRLLREALSALAHAHGFGLVHRDIKPENLLIAPRRQPADHRFRPGAGASGKIRWGHQPERNPPVRQSGAASGRAGGPAVGPLQPRGGGLLRPAGCAALPRP